MYIKCPNCKKTIDANSLFCSYCEFEISVNHSSQTNQEVSAVALPIQDSTSFKEKETVTVPEFNLNDYVEEESLLKEEDFFEEPNEQVHKKVKNRKVSKALEQNAPEQNSDYEPNYDGYYDDKLTMYEDEIQGLISVDTKMKIIMGFVAIIGSIIFLVVKL